MYVFFSMAKLWRPNFFSNPKSMQTSAFIKKKSVGVTLDFATLVSFLNSISLASVIWIFYISLRLVVKTAKTRPNMFYIPKSVQHFSTKELYTVNFFKESKHRGSHSYHAFAYFSKPFFINKFVRIRINSRFTPKSRQV